MRQLRLVVCLLVVGVGCGKKDEAKPVEASKPAVDPPSTTRVVPAALAGTYELPVSAETDRIDAEMLTSFVVVTADALHFGALKGGRIDGDLPGKKVASMEELQVVLRGGDPSANLDKRVQVKPPEEPQQEEEVAEKEEESGGTGQKQALEEGKMGKKDSSRPAGQYKMQRHSDPQLAKAQKQEAAQKSGILGTMNRQQGGMFASITGTGDFSSGFDDRDIQGGLLGDAENGRGVRPAGALSAAPPPSGSTLVVCDRAAPAKRLVEVLTLLPGAQLAVSDGKSAEARAFRLAYNGSSGRDAPPPDEPPIQLIIGLGDAGYRVSSSRGDVRDLPRNGRAYDPVALAAEWRRRKAEDPVFADRDDVLIVVSGGASAGELIDALGALSAAGVKTIVIGELVAMDEMQGGWGYGVRGTGDGAGGSTIGRGGYGTMGHGSGTGSGYGTGRARRATVPTVKIGNATATGDLDKNVIRRYIRQKLPQIEYCYQKQLTVTPTLQGTITAQFKIDPKGKVVSAVASGMGNKQVEECVAAVVKTIQFPKPTGGGFVQVSYPFTFAPGSD